ncbi:hypothetical protein AB0J90_25435 [Micromonospora sp. NPDC049523]|uniref:hypothetical protein n=1 Tax=Micromonospora sp. NPDC049523 TaxID=3155921 RepID=UPI0034325F88
MHRHDDKLANLDNALVRGRLAHGSDGWLLVPERVVESSPGNDARSALRTLRVTRRATRSYLDRRGLVRPRVEWDQFRKLADG